MNKTGHKKILQLARFYEPHLGGVETHVREINQVLVSQGFTVTVIAEQHDEALPLEENDGKITVFRIPVNDFKFKLFNLVFFKLKVWAWMAGHAKLFLEADIIQVHDVFWWIWPLYPLVYFKTFMTFHGWEGQYPVRFLAKLQRRFNSGSAKGTMHIGAWIEKFYGDRPSVVSYGGVSWQFLKVKLSGQKLSKNKIDKIKKIVFVGRLEKENELEKYLAVLEILRQKNQNLQVVFVGDGVWRELCSRQGKVMGLVKNPQQYVLDADLVFANSYLAILEAQALGKVVCVVYSHPLKKAYLETFPGKKYLLMASSPERLAQKILAFEKLSVGRRQILSKKITQFAHEQTWEKVVEQYLTLWHLEK